MSQTHRLSAGVVLVRQIADRPCVLLLRCYSYWDFPKGQCNKGEAPLSAAKREVAEETGLTELDFRWGPIFVETPPYGRGKVARYYLAEAPSGDASLPVNPEIGVPEHHEFRWVGLGEAHGLLTDRVRAVLTWAQDRITSDWS